MARPTSLKTIVSRLFSASQRPIYLLDGAGRIVFCNDALVEWTGCDEDKLLNLKCIHATTDASQELGSCLAPPPRLAEEMHCRIQISVSNDSGSSVRKASFFDLQDRSGTVLVLVDSKESTSAEDAPSETERLHAEVVKMRRLWQETYRLDELLGSSPEMRQVRAQAKVAVASNCRVVVVGNEGSGRETIARTIHHERTQGREMLIPLSCELLDADLLQTTVETIVRQLAELEDSESSVLLLLEVDQLSMEAQSALLGFLEIPELGLQTLATSRTRLSELVEQQKFRSELMCHLSSLEISVPALRDRIADIPALATWMLERSKHRERVDGFAPDAMECLLRYGWPRELTELKETIDAAANASSSSTITTRDLPPKFQFADDAAALPDIEIESVNLDEFMAEVESELIQRALRASKGNRAEAARRLGVSRGKLLRRIEQLGIEQP